MAKKLMIISWLFWLIDWSERKVQFHQSEIPREVYPEGCNIWPGRQSMQVCSFYLTVVCPDDIILLLSQFMVANQRYGRIGI